MIIIYNKTNGVVNTMSTSDNLVEMLEQRVDVLPAEITIYEQDENGNTITTTSTEIVEGTPMSQYTKVLIALREEEDFIVVSKKPLEEFLNLSGPRQISVYNSVFVKTLDKVAPVLVKIKDEVDEFTGEHVTRKYYSDEDKPKITERYTHIVDDVRSQDEIDNDLLSKFEQIRINTETRKII